MPSLDKIRLIQHPFYGPIYVFGDEDTISRQVAAGNEWEPEIAVLMAEAAVPGTDVLDIGANLGFSTLGMLKHGAKPRRVHCFEPQADVAAALQHNVEGKPVQVYGFALSDTMQSFTYLADPRNIGGTSLTSGQSPWHTMSTALDAMLSTFDAPVSLVKIDVEGHEATVLKGGQEFFKKHRPAIFIETWVAHAPAITAQLKEMGYLMSRKLGPMDYVFQPKEKELASSKPRPQDGSKLLGLVMIVKNEAHGIAKTLESFKPYIDWWTILDTGSTDGTQQIITRVMAGVPGGLYEEPFVDFSTSRNRALDLHGEATTFTIMPDADDVLEGGEALRPFLESCLVLGSWMDSIEAALVNIRRGDLSYKLPLILRTASKIRYKGRVHEHVDTIATVTAPVTVSQVTPPQSAEASRKRWERDLALLLGETDSRSAFYLAQTLQCLGKTDGAIGAYQDRIRMGGWHDETFEAKFRLAKLLGSTDAFLDAHSFDPKRAEPLYHIAKHYHAKDDHALTYLFARRAMELPKPDTTLFVDAEVYEWKAADLVATHAFYLGEKEAGLRAADRAVKARPTDERLRSNRAFYARSAEETFGAECSRIDFTPPGTGGWKPPEDYRALNPSILRDGDKWLCVIRTTNYTLIDGKYTTSDGGPIRTRNFMAELGPGLNIARVVEMDDWTGHVSSTFPVQGYEDCRLFRQGKTLFCTATACDLTNEGKREIVLLELDDTYQIVKMTPLRGPWSALSQKNWMPSADGAFTLYSVDPVVKIRADEKVTLHGGSERNGWSHGRLRGGGQVVEILKDTPEGLFPVGYLCIVHDVTWGGGKRTYLHRFVLLDDAFAIKAMSDPFYFVRASVGSKVEFCAGLALDGDRLVASFGVEDREAWLGVFSLKRVLAALRTDYVI